MSQHETHPLDERFRTALGQAERTPPPAVWQAVKAGRTGRRAGWFWRGWVVLAGIMLLMGGVSAYHLLASRHSNKDHTAQAASTPTLVTLAGEEALAPMHHSALRPGGEQREHMGAENPEQTSSTTGLLVNREHDDGAHEQKLGKGSFNGREAAPITTLRTVAPPRSQVPTGAVAINEPAAQVVLRADIGTGPEQTHQQEHGITTGADAEWMLPLRPIGTIPPEKLVRWQRLPDHPYVLRKGEWWLGAAIGAYTLRDEWRGTNRALVDALNNSSAPTRTWSLGAEISRQWRSGWSLRSGVHLERSEQQLSHQDRRVYVEQEITTYYVTLNTQVFQSSVDTVTTVTTEDRSTTGSVQRSMMRIPLELGYERGFGRWLVSLQGGLAVELTKARGATITVIDQEGSLASRPSEAAILRSRYPAQLLGSASLRGGYLINEHWRLWAGPSYMQAILPLGSDPGAHISPQRWGLLFGVSRSINCTRKP